jgi:lantibiotic leader peptide-processing serine protease
VKGVKFVFHRIGQAPRPRRFDPSDDIVVSAAYAAHLISALNRATSYAHGKGAVVIAAAGNDTINRNRSRDLAVLPADCTFVLQVSATGPVGWFDNPETDLDVPAFYTNYGQSRIDLSAPGGNVDLALPDFWFLDMVLSTANPEIGGWAWSAGTSMAAPHVAGVAALIISKHGGRLKPAVVQAIIRGSCDDLGKPGKDAYFGAGRVNALNAMN